MISKDNYFRGRDKEFPDELNEEILGNAARTLDLVNELLERAGRTDIHAVNSGWRPQSVNDATSNAAKGSRHLTAEAVDLPDVGRGLARWCCDNVDVLVEIGLWMEDPRWTPTWVHLQTCPPGSGHRIFIPSAKLPADPNFKVS